MSKSRNVYRGLAIMLIVAGLLPAVLQAPPKVGQIQVAKSIEGTANLDPAPDVYTVLAVPANWRQDAKSQDLVKGFSSQPNMVAMRQRGPLQAYAPGNADFEYRWSGRCPEVKQGQPVVLVTYGDQLLYKRSGGTAADVNRDLAGVLGRLPKNCPNCPQCRPLRPSPSPAPTPTPDDTPQIAPLPDTQPVGPVAGQQNIIGLGLLLSAVAGVAVFIGEFKSRLR